MTYDPYGRDDHLGDPSDPGPDVEPIDERDRDDGRCCGLAPDHAGCCAYFCSMCTGTGHMGCLVDDLGCACGFCDGWGYCAECTGLGWFNEAGEPCVVTGDDLAGNPASPNGAGA